MHFAEQLAGLTLSDTRECRLVMEFFISLCTVRAGKSAGNNFNKKAASTIGLPDAAMAACKPSCNLPSALKIKYDGISSE